MNMLANRANNIIALEAEMMSWPEEFKSMPPVEHCFSPGAYARTMLIPEGQMIVGKMHRHEHLNIISYGDISVSTYEGVVRFVGHNVFKSSPGVKRAVYANKNTMWTTIHLTEETDLEKIEEEVIIKMGSQEELDFISDMQSMIGEVK